MASGEGWAAGAGKRPAPDDDDDCVIEDTYGGGFVGGGDDGASVAASHFSDAKRPKGGEEEPTSAWTLSEEQKRVEALVLDRKNVRCRGRALSSTLPPPARLTLPCRCSSPAAQVLASRGCWRTSSACSSAATDRRASRTHAPFHPGGSGAVANRMSTSSGRATLAPRTHFVHTCAAGVPREGGRHRRHGHRRNTHRRHHAAQPRRLRRSADDCRLRQDARPSGGGALARAGGSSYRRGLHDQRRVFLVRRARRAAGARQRRAVGRRAGRRMRRLRATTADRAPSVTDAAKRRVPQPWLRLPVSCVAALRHA